MGDISLHFFDHLLMFIMGIVMPALSVLSARQGLEGIEITPEFKKSIYRNNSLFLSTGTLIILLVWISSGRDYQQLGLRPIPEDANPLWIYPLGAFILFYIFDLLHTAFSSKERSETIERWKRLMPFMPSTWREFYWFIGVSITAGVCEEIMFRGYIMNYILAACKGQTFAVPLAILIPAVVFGISHAYQGGKAVVKVVLMAVLFGYVFIFTGSIIWLIIIHILVDIFSSLAGVLLIREDTAT